ncbi:2-methylene-furan-3-one reductase-like protein [Tanacetum coccineum]
MFPNSLLHQPLFHHHYNILTAAHPVTYEAHSNRLTKHNDFNNNTFDIGDEVYGNIQDFNNNKLGQLESLGGGGGGGTLVVQLAKQVFGASKVVATSSNSKMDFLKSLGVDKVYDYTRTRYEEIEEKYDMVYDTIGDSYVAAKENVPVIDITWLLGFII